MVGIYFSQTSVSYFFCRGIGCSGWYYHGVNYSEVSTRRDLTVQGINIPTGRQNCWLFFCMTMDEDLNSSILRDQ